MSWRDGLNEEEEEEEEDEQLGSDHVIFLIDARMEFEAIRHCLTVLLSVAKAKVVAENKSNVGVVFFGTEHKNAEDGSPENIFTLFSLDPPSAARIKLIAGLLRDKEKFDSHIGRAGTQNPAVLKEALWMCCQHFNSKRSAHKDLDLHRVWIFTDDDDPCAGDASERDRTFTIAKDAHDSGGEISLWIIASKTRAPFNINTFYKPLLFLESDDELPFRMITSGDAGFDNLSYLRKKEYRKRSLCTVPLILGQDLQLSVSVYKLLKLTTKPYAKNLYKPNNELLKTVSRQIDAYGTRLDPSSIKTYVPVGGTRVYLSKEEADALKFGGRTSGSIRLLRCINAADLGLEQNTGTSYFLYPNESTIKGSSALFSALLNDMAAKGLIGVAEFVRTKSSTVKLVALMPQVERVSEDGQLMDSAGFNMIPLPFATDVRKTPAPVSEAALQSTSEHAVSTAEKLINAFQLEDSFDYSLLENPSIQKFYAVLQAIALTEEEIEWTPSQDKLQPNAADVANFEDLFEQFKSSLGLDEPQEKAAKKGRGASKVKAEGEEKETKKGKAGKASVSIDDEEDADPKTVVKRSRSTTKATAVKSDDAKKGRKPSKASAAADDDDDEEEEEEEVQKPKRGKKK